MKLNNKSEIVIRQVLMNGDKVSFVEYWSENTTRNHIINASRFSEIFGYSMDELRKIAGDPNE